MADHAGFSEETKTRARQAYHDLNDSPLQQAMREVHRCDVGVVHWNPQVEDPADVRHELQRMKDTGFTYVRFHAIGPFDYHCGDEDAAALDFTVTDMYLDLAAEVGLIAYPHFADGRLSERALADAGLTLEEAQSLGPNDSQVRKVMRARIRPVVEHYRDHPALGAWPVSGEPNATGLSLRNDIEKGRFIQWLKECHGDPETLNRNWSIYPNKRKPLVDSWEKAVELVEGVNLSESAIISTGGLNRHELYGAVRDLIRFQADGANEWIRVRANLVHELDPHHPVLVGNHQFFINNPQLGWDIFSSARLGDCHFSSIHISWHFEQVEGELDRPVYMTAKMTHDAFKGGLTSAYETTGGPVQYSGGYGNHMDADLMRKLMFSYLASGNQNIAFWDWAPRPGGIESGEYGMVSLSGKITEWAQEAGAIAGRMQEYSREIWESYEEPDVGLLRSWDSEAICLLEPMRHELREDGPTAWSRGSSQQHMRGLIGAARTAINQHLAYEYVTEEELREGIACCYPVLYMPHVRACSVELMQTLLEYVEAGGRLVADVQFAFCDQWGKLHPRGEGSPLDRLFGGWIDNIHDARTRPLSVDGVSVRNFYGSLETTSAETVVSFSDGRPAVSETTIGRGQSVLLAFDPARECWRPDNPGMESLLGSILRGERPVRWDADHELVFRRSGPSADHWFLLNDGDERTVTLHAYDREYREGLDVLSGEGIPVGPEIAVRLPAYSGLWLRFES